MKANWTVLEIVLYLIGIAFVAMLFFDAEGIQNLLAIQFSTSVLITDYLSVGGLHATLANAGFVLILNLTLLRLFKIKIDGLILAALFTILGFAFFGKNVINSFPIYLGVILYGYTQNIKPEIYMGSLLFSSGLAPLVSFIMFGLNLPFGLCCILGLLGGLLAGFLVLPIASKTKVFHQGYNLYNVGFTLGFISLLYAVVFQAFDLNLTSNVPVSTQFNEPLWIMIGFLIGVFWLLAIIFKASLKNYVSLIQTSGLSMDYMKMYGPGTAFLNMAIMGTLSLIIIWGLNFSMNGPVVAGIFTVIGFGAFGKHPVNSFPVMTGAVLAVFITNYSFDSVGMVIAVFFVTTLAPVAGKYGIFAGIAAGFIHVLITPFAYVLQGGLDLYNNGFAAGFAAVIVVSFMEPVMAWLKSKEAVGERG